MTIRKEDNIVVKPQVSGRVEGRSDYVFYSFDKESAQFIIAFVDANDKPLDLLNANPTVLLIIEEDGKQKKFVLDGTDMKEVSIIDGKVAFIIPDFLLGYRGKVEMYIGVTFADGSSSDELHLAFTMKESPFNAAYEEAKNYYVANFEMLLHEVELAKTTAINDINKQLPEIKKKLSDVESRIEIADQNFNELRNDLKLSEAWAWSADGTDRFTDKYPIDNLLPNSMFNSQMGWTASMLDVGSTQSGIANGEAWMEDLTATTSRWKQWQIYFDNNRYPDIFELIKANPNKRVTVSVDVKVEGNTIKNPGVIEVSLKSSTNAKWAVLKVDDTKISSEYIRYTATGTLPSDFNNVQNFRLILMFNGNGRATFTKPKLAIGNDGFYTPAPSEDYENAYPQYRGLALLPSDLPDDYSWDLAPEYVEGNLATDAKISEITGKANKYTDNSIAAVNTNVANIADDLAKQINANKSAAESYADTKKTEAVNESKKYTDEAITNITPNRTSLRIESGFSDGFTGWVTFERIGDIVIVSYALSPSTNTGTWKTPLPIASIPEEFRFSSNAYSTGSIATSNISNDICQVGMNAQGLQFASWNRTAGIAQFAGQLTGAVKSREK
nr:BppU family phage baseplate upper protein [Enterococcus faecium]